LISLISCDLTGSVVCDCERAIVYQEGPVLWCRVWQCMQLTISSIYDESVCCWRRCSVLGSTFRSEYLVESTRKQSTWFTLLLGCLNLKGDGMDRKYEM